MRVEEPIRVLLVEDNLADARLLATALRESNSMAFEVKHVARLKEAAELLGSGATDVVALDLTLPDGSGLETVRKMRSIAPGIPIVVMTGVDNERLALAAMRAGVQDYLVKGRSDSTPARALRYAVERKRAEESFQASEERFRLLVDGVKDYAILMLDAGGCIASWNDGAQRIYGYSAAEAMGLHFSCFHAPEGSKAGEPETALRRTAEVGRYAFQGWRIRKDRSRFWADVVVTVLHDECGLIRGFAKVTRDITQRKADETELLRAKEVAEAANRAKDDFLAVVSHELRTPLTPVLSLASHLASQPDLSEALRADLGTIRRNVEMEARLIDDLLDVTRIIRNKIELKNEMVDAHLVVVDALRTFQAQMDGKGLTCSLSLQATKHHVWADSGRLHQVFVNLLSNAVKFTPEGGSIFVGSSSGEEGQLKIQISDSGIGIEPNIMPCLFDHFEQGERSVTRDYGGLGLGLSICKSIIEMHRGTIEVTSEGRNKGTTLTVELIVAQQAHTHQPVAAVSCRQNEGQGRILLVEDHRDSRIVMARLLKSSGWSVLTAGSVKEALEVADAAEFDVLVSDIQLPDGTGMDVIKQIKARRQIKGIAISGLGYGEDLQRSLDAGFEMHLTKPLDVPTLEDALRTMVRQTASFGMETHSAGRQRIAMR